jgi:Uma2 family endonuclease
MNGWLCVYEARTPGLVLGDNSTVRLDLDNEPQPDVLLLVDPALGGQATISEDDYVEGAPELVGEIASSSASYDVGVKLRAYRRNGVREYVVHRVLDGKVDWYVLRDGSYVKLSPDDGILKSEVFPGLWLDAAAFVRGDIATVLDVLAEGLATAEHGEFVQSLKAHE